MTLEPTPQPPPRGDAPSTPPTVLGLPIEAAPTAMGLRMLAGTTNLLRLDPKMIATQLYPAEPTRAATERVILHIVMLEEAGWVQTWIADGQEWLRTIEPGQNPPPQTANARLPDPFSPAGERGKEETRARAREQARARARERMEAEERDRAARWDAWNRDQSHAQPRRPERPALLDAPRIGCPDHPHGTFEECGPCGTAAARRKEYLTDRKYFEQLSIFEEQTGEVIDDDEPF